jgi:hypothetical protein
MAHDRVYSVWDYRDGPRSGVADYMGTPHFYRFDKKEDNYTETFLLKPIDNETFQLVVEQWAIWRKWELAFVRGEISHLSQTAVRSQDPKYSELDSKIKNKLNAISSEPILVRGRFRVRSNQPELQSGMSRELDVRWLRCISIDLKELKQRLPELKLSRTQETTAFFLLDGLNISSIAAWTDCPEEEVNIHLAEIEQALRNLPPDEAATVTPPKSPRPSPLRAAIDIDVVKRANF